jgi:hypothetical protein
MSKASTKGGAVLEPVPQSIDEVEVVAKARTQLETAATRHGRVQREISEHRAIVDPRVETRAGSASPLEVLAAKKRLLDLELEELTTAEAVVRAQRELSDALEGTRNQIRSALQTQRRVAVAELDMALAAAAVKSNAVRAIEQRLIDLLPGEYVDPLSWPDLAPSSADGTFESRLDAWRRACRSYGCLPLDEPASV